MKLDEKTLDVEYIYKGRILNLRKDKVELPDGSESVREVIEHSGGSCVYCEVDGKVLLVKQFRYPYKKQILELPAGKLNAGENPYDTAIRELEEEGGMRAKTVELIHTIYPSTGYTEEIIYIYRAKDVVKTQTNLDEGEFLDSVWIDKQTLKQMVKDGEINDAKTLVALLSEL